MKAKDQFTKAGAALSEFFVKLRKGFLDKFMEENEEEIFSDLLEDDQVIDKVSDVFVEFARKFIRTLPYLLSKIKLDFVEPEVTEQNFPADLVDYLEEKKYELFNFGGYISFKDVIHEIEREFRPATIREQIRWAVKNWDRKKKIVALGSVWDNPTSKHRFCFVPVLEKSQKDLKCELNLYTSEFDFDGDCNFLAVKK